MGTIPAPNIVGASEAISQNPLQEYARAVTLHAQQQAAAQDQQLRQQQIQQGQIQLQDQQAGLAALKEWDGNDLSTLPALIQKHGGSFNAVMGARQSALEYHTKLLGMKKDELALEDTKNNAIAGHLDYVKGLAPAEQPQGFENAKSDLMNRGYMSPQEAQAMQYPGPEGLDGLIKLHQSHTQQTEDLLKKGQTQEAVGRGKQAETQSEADLWKPAGEGTLYNVKTGQLVQGVLPPDRAQFDAYIKRGGDPATYAAWKAKQEAIATEPVKTRIAATEAATNAAIHAQYDRGTDPAVQNVSPKDVGKARAEYSKAGQEFAAANQAAQGMQDFIAEAKAGNKEAVKVVPLQGALEITTAQGVHRINRTEVDQLAGAGSLYDKLAGKVGHVLTGKDIDDSVLNDMKELAGTVQRNARGLHENKVKSINQAYGSDFKPMDFGGGNSAPTQPAATSGGFNWAAMPEHK